MQKRTMIVDETTGEIVSDKSRTISAAFDEEKGYLLWPRKNFARSFADIDFPAQMTMIDRGRMATLAKRIWSNTNMLGYRGNGGVRPYDYSKIGEVIGLKERQARTFVDKMVRFGVMAKVNIEIEGKKEIHFYVSPLYFFSSNRIPLNLYLIFRKQLDAVLPQWVIQRFREQKVIDLGG